MNIQEIKHEFEGTGEMKTFNFSLLQETEKGFMYKVKSEEGTLHYEVFKKELTPICIDFAKRIYSETEFKYKYPKANNFGKWAWCTTELKNAEEILQSL
jgi:hypothetical protein